MRFFNLWHVEHWAWVVLPLCRNFLRHPEAFNVLKKEAALALVHLQHGKLQCKAGTGR
jgi:hypothetical protein